MKKIINSGLAFLICIGLCLSLFGCSTSKNEQGNTPVSEKADEKSNKETSDSDVMYSLTFKSVSDEELKEAAAIYQGYLSKILPVIPEIWPGINPQYYSQVITNGNKHYAVSAERYEEITDTQNEDELQKDLLTLQNAPSLYKKSKYKGEPVTVMNLAKLSEHFSEADRMGGFITLMHEAFHFYTQPDWKLKDTIVKSDADENAGNMRASKYPLNEEPRVLRTMIYNSLYSALRSETEEDMNGHLSDAKFWYEKWEAEFPDEYGNIMETDIAEGTAEYFSNEIRRILENNNEINEVPEDRAASAESADVESYSLGDLAIQLLKKQNRFEVSTYEQAGKTPLESLLENTQASTDAKENDVIRSAVSKNIQATNQQISNYFSNYIDADKNGKATYLGVSAGPSGIATSGFYYLTDISKTGWQDSTISHADIQIENCAVFEYKDMYLIPVSADKIIFDSDTLSINADGITMKNPMKYEKLQDENGNIIYKLSP